MIIFTNYLTVMEEILDLPVETNQKANFANFGQRFIAVLIDGVILWVADFLVERMAPPFGSSFSVIGLQPTYVLIALLYDSILESSSKQGTVGKMVMRLKVGNAYGEKISFANAVGRHFGKYLSTILIGIGYLMMLWDSKSQTLHDKLADTYVFKD
jgi:uncharacterized RDD family membrane protein YckC